MKGKLYAIDSRRWPGVYGYDSTSKAKVHGRPDTCFYITYKVDGRKRWEKLGWRGEGYSPQLASEHRAGKIRGLRHGGEVKTDRELRAEKKKHNQTIDDIKEAYFASDKGLNAKGRKIDLIRYEKHLKKTFGKRTVASLSTFDIERIKSATRNLSPASTYNVLELLRRIINYGSKSSLCPKLSFVIELPERDNQVTEYLTPDEVKRLMNTMKTWESQDAPRMLQLALLSGMRRGEIFKLQEDDCDFSKKLITLRSAKSGKTESIPMSRPVEDLLKAQIEDKRARFLGVNKKRNDESKREAFRNSPYLFPGPAGNKRTDCSAVDRIKADAGLPKNFRIFHGLRHHLAVTLANSGEFTLDMIGELLTHKSNRITRRYAKFLPGSMRAASNKAAELLQKFAASDNVVQSVLASQKDHG